jgi:hypothetical protein
VELPGTEHVFVGAGDGPCAVLMIGSRREVAAHYTSPSARSANHINILPKLGVHSQLQALVLALRYDMVKVRKGQMPPAEERLDGVRVRHCFRSGS